jgi:uncharacterized protein (TIGR02757 family)
MQAIGNHPTLKQVLETFYRQYDLRQRIAYDPVELPHRYKKKPDRETVGFIASCLSYGRVDLFKPVIEKILRIAGTGPYEFMLNLDIRRDAHLFDGIKYRMNSTKDILAFLHLLSVLLKENGTLGAFFKHNFIKDEPNVIPALSKFVKAFYSGDTSSVYGRNVRPFGLLQMLPSPDKGSTCKRAHMFLRWMVRGGDGVDFGLWTFIPADRLILPLDTHTARIARHLGLTKRKTTDIKTAIDITNSLKQFDPDDPVKYDFALCHLGISGRCPSKKSVLSCLACPLKDVCVD